MRPIVRGFCINRFGIGPLHYISSRSDFGFAFAEIFEKRLADSEYPFKRRLLHQYAELIPVFLIQEPYVRRCASTRIVSAEKLMYICKNQLGECK